MPLFFAFLTGLGLTVILVPLARRIARHFNLCAKPSNDRWHSGLVPNIGGVAMFLPLAVVAGFSGALGEVWPVMAAATLMFGLGVADDVRPVRASTKLAVQTLIAAALLWMMPPVVLTGLPLIDLLLEFLWIVGITNALNLLDNIDGLAAGVSAIAGTFFLAVLLIDGSGNAGGLGVIMAGFVGVTAGFLLFNFHPASIFMGDGGSHLLGAFLAAATLFSARSSTSHLVPVTAIPILLLLIPIFDTAFVTLARGLAGRSAFLGGRDHVSHRLVALGIGERRAVLMLYALSCAGGAVALGLIVLTPGFAWALVGFYAIALVMIGLYLGHIESALAPEIDPPLPSELTTRYRAYEVVLDVALLGLAYYLAYLARFREPEFTRLLPAFLSTFPIVVGLQIATLWISGKYRTVWAQIGPTEILSLFRSTIAGVAGSVIAVLYLTRFEGYSRLVFAFDAILAPVLVISARVTLIGLDQYLRRRRSRGRTALIYGAGRGGALAVRELLQNPTVGLTPIGFLDDDPAKRRLKIDGLPVLGSLADLEAILDRPRTRVSAVVVAVSDLSSAHFDRLCDVCASRDVAVRRIRFAIEDVRRRSADQVVAFPRQPGVR